MKLGTELNELGVPMDWINYSTLRRPALLVAEFTTALRTAECVFFKFLDEHEGGLDDFKLEARFLNRLSKMSHLYMVLQNHLSSN